ncbi:MAG: VCBS repeat-containing protein [Planctomycetota bacterium]|nr:MAG: VCBS repeat-containing protein [Planctomycetota bacterium]REJ96730.1 MAG: VCBS repeat-containing protein [Planctomycetota bacterium]REK22332.1 MAG: VCBS repeat-containing protein [Planctomycetota bacterium]REK41041.1 MAG: VCBS repeat-containing protein [Planctomycetota bacterium]
MSPKRGKKRAPEPAQPKSSSWWVLPVVVLVVGVGAILYALSGDADRSSARPDSGSGSTQPAPVEDDLGLATQIGTPPASSLSTSPPVELADSGVIELSTERSWQEIDDPTTDGWQTEVIHEKIKKQLDRLGKLIVGEKKAEEAKVARLVADDFRGTPLRPAERDTVYEQGGLIIERTSLASLVEAALDRQGASGLVSAIEELTAPLAEGSNRRYEFKVVRVDPDGDGVETEQLLSLSARTPTGMVEQHATWVARWSEPNSKQPKLSSLRVTRFEETRSVQASGPLLVDCTASALGGNESFEKQILRGLNHWLDRTQFRTVITMIGAPGIAVGDVNGDGLEDLYLCQEAAVPNRLFLQQPDGTARDMSAAWGVDWIDESRGVLLVDLDNDGDQDLVVATPGNLVLAANIESARFEVRRVLPIHEDPSSLCALDYDLDGRLDVYVCAYHPDQLLSKQGSVSVGVARSETVFHDANDSAPNQMFRNIATSASDWQFEDVTVAIGLDENNRRWSLAAAAEDYDNDGDMDLYVANDYGRDNLYRNDVGEDGQRRFVEIGRQARAEQAANGMGITWGDYNGDGWLDAYVSNMWSSAGHRVTRRPQFMPAADDQLRRRVEHFAVGNSLLKNQGDGLFVDRSAAAGVARGRWAWGSQFADLNNDGWEDLIVANGYITTEDTGDL